jgi:hypothetical protein
MPGRPDNGLKYIVSCLPIFRFHFQAQLFPARAYVPDKINAFLLALYMIARIPQNGLDRPDEGIAWSGLVWPALFGTRVYQLTHLAEPSAMSS